MQLSPFHEYVPASTSKLVCGMKINRMEKEPWNAGLGRRTFQGLGQVPVQEILMEHVETNWIQLGRLCSLHRFSLHISHRHLEEHRSRHSDRNKQDIQTTNI